MEYEDVESRRLESLSLVKRMVNAVLCDAECEAARLTMGLMVSSWIKMF